MILSEYVVKLSSVQPDNLRSQPHTRSPLVKSSPRSWAIREKSTTTTKPLSAIRLSTQLSQSSRACDQSIFALSRIRARRSPAAQRASRSTRSRNRQTAQQRTQPSKPPRRLTARSSRRRHPQQQTAPHRRTARPSAHPRLASTRTRCAKSETRVTRRSSSACNSQAQRTPHRRVDEVAPAGHKDAVRQRLRHQQEQAAVDRQPLSCIAHLIRADVPEAIGIQADIHTTHFLKTPNSKHKPVCNLQET